MTSQLPALWTSARIGDLTDIVYGKSLREAERAGTGGVPVYSSSGIIGEHDDLLHPGPSIVLGRKGSVGSVYYVPGPLWCIDTAFYLDNVSSAVNLEFLAHALRVLNLARLSIVVGVPGISRKDIEVQEIPLPPLPEQQHIVEILLAADELRQLRAQANQRAQDLLPALFHEMFGTFANEATGFSELEAVAEVVSGVAKGRKLRADRIREVPYIRVANVQDGFLDLSEVKTIRASEDEIDLYRLRKDDVLLTEGGDFDKLGRGALWDADIPDCIHQNHIFRVRLDQDEIRPQFFVQYLQTPFVKMYFLRAAKRTTNLASINLTQLRALPMPKIEVAAQDQFVAAAQKVNQIALDCTDSKQHIDKLFQSLLARAFTGELTADWREVHHEELAQAARERDELLGQKTTVAITAPASEQLPLPLAQPKRAAHAALDKRTVALLAAAETHPAYFRPEDLVDDNGLDLVQAEAGLRVLAALGFVRMVQLDGRRVWRLVDAVDESVEKPLELAS